MTKEQFVTLILTKVNGGETLGRYHYGDVERHAEMAYNQAIYEVFENVMKFADHSQLDEFTKPYTLTVVDDADRKQKYSVLPVSVVVLPDNRGIRRLANAYDRSIEIYAASTIDEGYMGLLEVGQMGIPTYRVEGEKKVWYENVDNDTVFAQLIPQLSEYDDEDELPMIAGKDGVLFEMCVNRIMGNIPEDKYNDAR